MTITKTIDVRADRRVTLPSEVPSVDNAAMVDDCPLCAKHRDPLTGELRLNAETITAIEEVDDMLAGKIPNTLKSFNSLEEMLADLDSDD